MASSAGERVADSQRLRLLRPVLGARIVARPRLFAKLDAMPQATLVSVVAPAGFGKTTLIADWLARSGAAVAWVTLDERDDAPARLAEVLMAAMRTVAPGWALQSLLDADPPLTEREWAKAIAREWMGGTGPDCLVIDDAHLLRDGSARQLLQRLVALVIGRRIVLLCRGEAPIDLTAQRAVGQALEVTGDDLRFDREEARRLAQVVGGASNLEPRVDEALAMTDGWPAALRLRLAAGDRLPGADVDATVDWLVDGALALVPRALAERLLYGALASDISDGLLDAALPPGMSIDAIALNDAGSRPSDLLVAPYEGGVWYRLHPLVRDTLARRVAEREGEAGVRATHLRIARWCEDNGMVVEAATHALRGKDRAYAAEIVERAGFLALNQERWDLVARYLDVLPSSIVDGSAGLLTLVGWREYYRPGRGVHVPEALMAARRALANRDAASSGPTVATRLDSHLAILETYQLDPVPGVDALIARTRAIVDVLGQEDDNVAGILLGTTGLAVAALRSPEDGRAWLAACQQRLAPGQVGRRVNVATAAAVLDDRLGRPLDERQPVLEEIQRLGREHGLQGSQGVGAIGLGWLAVQRLDGAAATTWFEAGLMLEGRLPIHSWRWARGGMALAAALEGDARQAAAHAAAITEALGVIDQPLLASSCRSFQARIALLTARLDQVAAWLDASDDGDWPPLVFPESVALTRLRALLALRRVDPATLRERIRETHAAVVVGGGDRWLLDGLVLCEAIAVAQGGDRLAAVAMTLPVAVAAAERGDLFALVEYGAAIQPLVDGCRSHGLAASYADRVGEAIARLETRFPNPLALRKRELEVLRLMAEPLSFEEIAARLFITPETARRHAHNIYRRFGVRKRREAVEFAERLGSVW